MKRFSEQLHKKAMTVKLRAAEKRDLRERVISYMEYHPLPAEMKQTKTARSKKLLTEAYTEVAFPFKLVGRWAAGVAVLILLVIPFAAERSVPGDTLYAVKQFNEELRGTLAFDAVQKVEWETERLNRRIAEARLLANEGRLTDEVEVEVAEAVRTQSENVQKNIEALRAEDADEATLASIALETTLSVQSTALQEEDAESTDGETGASEMTTNQPSILATVLEETRAKTNAVNASSTIPAFDKVMAKVEQNTTRVYELRNSLVDVASTEQIAEITRRIEDIERSVSEAVELRDEDDEAARAILVDALQRTQRLIVFMTDLEVSQSVDIERLVPMVLTDEEEEAILMNYGTELDDKISRINEALASTTEVAVVEKVTIVLAEIEAQVVELSTSTEFTEAKSTLESALDLANNIFTLLELEIDEAAVDSPDSPASPTDIETNATTSSATTSSEVNQAGDSQSNTDEVRVVGDGTATGTATTTNERSTTTAESDVDSQ